MPYQGLLGRPEYQTEATSLCVIEPLGDRLSVLHVALHAQGQGLDALEELPGALRGDRRAEVTQELHAGLDDVGNAVAEGVGVAHAVVGRVGVGEAGEAINVLRPRELAAVHDDAGHDGAVTAEELGRRVQHDVGAVLQRAHQVGGGDSVVDDEGQTVLVGDVGDGVNVEHVDLGLPMDSAKKSLVFGRTARCHASGLS